MLEALWSHVPFAEAVARAEVQRQVSAFEPNNWVLLASLLITFWGGLSVTRVLQDAVSIADRLETQITKDISASDRATLVKTLDQMQARTVPERS